MPADSPTRYRAAVLGHPVAHSLSPVLHRTAYRALGLDREYGLHDVGQEGLAEFVDGLDGTWAGLSLTMPLKEAVIPLLDDLDAVAAATGSVNTVVLDDAGRHGWNTDVAGIAVALDEHRAGSRTATVLGAGATARSAVAALAGRGTALIALCARRPESAADAVATGERLGARVEVRPWHDAEAALAADVVVSTVPKGVSDALAAAVPTDPGCLLDVVYDPWPTPLAAAWARAGGAVASGLDMLLHQAVRQVSLMTGVDIGPDVVAAMRAALAEAAAAR